MAKRVDALLLWTPRLIGLLVCLFLSAFALDAVGGGKSFLEALPDFLVHLGPMLLLAGALALSWRWEWIGGVMFTGLALAYAYVARPQASWIFVISGPLLASGILFFLSWSQHRRLHDTT